MRGTHIQMCTRDFDLPDCGAGGALQELEVCDIRHERYVISQKSVNPNQTPMLPDGRAGLCKGSLAGPSSEHLRTVLYILA